MTFRASQLLWATGNVEFLQQPDLALIGSLLMMGKRHGWTSAESNYSNISIISGDLLWAGVAEAQSASPSQASAGAIIVNDLVGFFVMIGAQFQFEATLIHLRVCGCQF